MANLSQPSVPPYSSGVVHPPTKPVSGAGVNGDDRSTARRAFARREYGDAVQSFERAREKSPQDVPLMLELAQAYGLTRRYDAAAELLAAAMRAAPDRVEVFGVAGQLFDQMRRHDDAVRCYRVAAKLNPRSVASHTRLASMYERTHRLEEARKAVGRALAIHADAAEASLIQTILDRREGNLSLAKKRLRKLISKAPPKPILWKAWYELAHVCDPAERIRWSHVGVGRRESDSKSGRGSLA